MRARPLVRGVAVGMARRRGSGCHSPQDDESRESRSLRRSPQARLHPVYTVRPAPPPAPSVYGVCTVLIRL